MAKITVHGGPSDQLAPPGQPGHQPPAAQAEAAPEAPTPVIVVDADADGEADDAVPPSAPLDELTVVELRERLRAAGLGTSGTKDELRDRLAVHELAHDGGG